MKLNPGITLLAAGLGAAAAGVAAGAVAERKVVRAPRLRPDAGDVEPFGALPFDRSYTVTAGDGVELYVEEVGNPVTFGASPAALPEGAGQPLTIIFSHGYTLEMACWHFQRQELADLGRLVFWDQRSHGRSGRSRAENCTIDQLGDDLLHVLDTCAPEGRVILVGHSMGGMTIMALAAQRPDLFLAGGRVAGVALVGTSAGKLAQVSLGLPAAVARLTQGITPKVWIGLGKRGTFVDARRQRGMGSDIGYALTRRLSFGDKNVSPILVEIMERMINATSAEVISAFAPAFLSHDKLAALANLRDIPVLVLNGSADVLTPPDHSDAIVAELPDAEHVVVQGAGHMVMMEQPELTNSHLRSLVSRSFAARVG